ncbi:hypothetical protein JYU34_016247 [Plutella xylostella]|uniref:Cuticular protein n=1 Tax=Plutella xylostella TaxID=51655 RepID=A0ABQ7Q274_PLUXY|nr:hypothetical protein JYU34_016247 [Plutella xylostella]
MRAQTSFVSWFYVKEEFVKETGLAKNTKMFKVLMLVAATVALSSAAPNNVFEIDISPEEAQRYLSSPPFTDPQLTARTNVLPLVRWNDPRFRAAEAGPTLGHYWKNGKEIENTDDYVEEVYDASQFHGQDGLGAYAYGYKGPDSAKVENRVQSGDVTGSYTYRDGDNNLIKVRYWADSEGFHQEDNLPKVVLEPAQETEEVRQARLAHEQAWKEAAAAAAQQPDPQGEYSPNYDQGSQYQGSQYQGAQYQAQQNQGPQQYQGAAQPQYQAQAQAQYQGAPQYQGQQYQAAASEPHESVVPADAQTAQSQQAPVTDARQGKAYYANAQASFQQQPGFQGQQLRAQGQGFQAQGFGQVQGQQGQGVRAQSQAYQGQAQGQASYQKQQAQLQDEEPTGPPRGFFYSFDYPVSVIVAKNAAGQGGPVNPGQPIDHDTVGVNARG